MGFASKPWIFIVGVVLFFIGFNMLSHTSELCEYTLAKVHQKGAALRVGKIHLHIREIFIGGM